MMHAGMIPAGPANTRPKERESSEERQACVFIDSGAKKRGSGLLPSFIVSCKTNRLSNFFALHKQQISIQHALKRNHPLPVILTASCWSDLRSSHTFTRSHHKFRHQCVNNNAALTWDLFFVSFCVWQTERQWLVDVGLIQDALAAVCHNYQGARSYTQTHKYTHLPWLARKERLVWLVAVFTPKALY